VRGLRISPLKRVHVMKSVHCRSGGPQVHVQLTLIPQEPTRLCTLGTQLQNSVETRSHEGSAPAVVDAIWDDGGKNMG
jgi:hypothetical protein